MVMGKKNTIKIKSKKRKRKIGILLTVFKDP